MLVINQVLLALLEHVAHVVEAFVTDAQDFLEVSTLTLLLLFAHVAGQVAWEAPLLEVENALEELFRLL